MKNYIKLGLIVLFVGAIIWGGDRYVEKITQDEPETIPVKTDKQVDDELQKIMNEENFKKATVLRARKVASDNKRLQEDNKNKSIIEAEKLRHEGIVAEIEKENEAIRTEELLLVGTTANLK